jgi:hypothetical protein
MMGRGGVEFRAQRGKIVLGQEMRWSALVASLQMMAAGFSDAISVMSDVGELRTGARHVSM